MAGRRPVEEAFAAGREGRRLLVVPQRRQALERIVLHATNLRIPIVEVEGGTLTALAGFDGHQGVAVVVPPRRYATLDEILARAIERDEPPFVLALDSLEDPQNVGTLLRSAEAAGVHGVIFPTHRQAPMTPAAVKASAGAVEHLLLCPVDDLAGALADLHARGLRVAGAEADAPLTARQTDLRGPLAIVVGSEGQGLGPAVRRRCDMVMRIPMNGVIDSLNAAVAGSILVFEALAQRDPEGRSRRRPPARPLPPIPAAEVATTTEGPVPGRDTDDEPTAEGATTADAAEANPRSDAADVVGSVVEPVATAPRARKRKTVAATSTAAETTPPAEAEPDTPEPPPERAEPPEPARPPARRRSAPRSSAAPAPDPAEPTATGEPPTAAPIKRRRARAKPEPVTGDDDDGDLLPGGPPPGDAS